MDNVKKSQPKSGRDKYLTRVKFITMFDREPNTWKELQKMVAQIFTEMNWDTEIEKTINLVRGTVNVDVWAKAIQQTPQLMCICECKYWNKPVNKSVVHSFRTVIHDSGADMGLLISRKGFQQGAVASAENSNIRLLSWSEFLIMFDEVWSEAIARRLAKEVQKLATYCHQDIDIDIYGLASAQEYLSNWKKIFDKAMHIVASWTGQTNKAFMERLPFKMLDPSIDTDNGKDFTFIEIKSKRQYIELMLPKAIEYNNEFEKLCGKLTEKELRYIFGSR